MAETFQRPGWYPDPDGAGERWWNGSGWSDSKRGGPAAPVPAPAAVPAPPAPVPPVVYSAGNPAPQRPDPYAQQPGLAGSVQSSRSYSIDARVNRNAMVGFITGIIALFFNILGVLGIVAIVFSVLGITKARQLKAQGVTKNLMTFALVGLATGLIASVTSLITLIIAIVAFSSSMS
jgi:hypothetical protein